MSEFDVWTFNSPPEPRDPTDVQGWDHPGYQQCRKDRSVQAQRIAALEAENGKLRLELADLWVFVHAYRREKAAPTITAQLDAWKALQDAEAALTPYEHGLPLPGAGEPS